MSMVLRWRIPERRIVSRWRAPLGMLSALQRNPPPPIAAIIGPPGPAGPQGLQSVPVRIDAPLAATWVLSNPIGRMPTVHVYLASGEPVLTDIAANPSQITVTFSTPQQGFVLVF